MSTTHATTVLLVRRDGRVAMVSDGQVTLGQTILKRGAAKVRRAGKGKVLVGFAGGAADGLALFGRFETKLEESNQNLERAVVELAKEWRTDRALRQLDAVMLVADAERTFLVSGQGDLLQPDQQIMNLLAAPLCRSGDDERCTSGGHVSEEAVEHMPSRVDRRFDKEQDLIA